MFSWCQSINVYNIEKHYHIYCDQKHEHQLLSQSNPLSHPLKTGSISMTTSINSKPSSKSLLKKGLSLSKQLDSIQNICKKNYYKSIQFKDLKSKILHDQPKPSQHFKFNQSKHTPTQDQSMNKKIKRKCSMIDPIPITPITDNPQLVSNSIKQLKQAQKIHYKNKPLIEHTIDQEQQSINDIILKRVNPQEYNHFHTNSNNNNKKCIFVQNYNNQKNKDNDMYYTVSSHSNNNNGNNNNSNINNSNININSNIDSNKNSSNNNLKNNNITNKRSTCNVAKAMLSSKDMQKSVTSYNNGTDLADIIEQTKNIKKNSKYQSQYDQSSIKNHQHNIVSHHRYSHSQSFHKTDNNKQLERQPSTPNYPQSSSKSMVKNQEEGKQNSHKTNQFTYLKILQTFKGPIKQASIMLSNILSRNSQIDFNCSSYKPGDSTTSKKNNYNKRINLWQGHQQQTIFSCQNNTNSNCSVKIQESQIEDIDPRNNFGVIKNKSINNTNYSISLAIQLNILCLVSLKKSDFRQMSLISQQLQMYQFVQQNFKGRQLYRNILQLYQIQMSNGSYILIKQPFTQNLPQYSSSLPAQQHPKFQQQLAELIKSIINQFSKYMIHPNRMLNINDFVVCDSVIKIHDLSLFRQMNQPIYSLQKIMENFDLGYDSGKQ